jgi:hypothetical protein
LALVVEYRCESAFNHNSYFSVDKRSMNFDEGTELPSTILNGNTSTVSLRWSMSERVSFVCFHDKDLNMFRLLFSVVAASGIMLAIMPNAQADALTTSVPHENGLAPTDSILSPLVTPQQLLSFSGSVRSAASDFIVNNVPFGSLLATSSATPQSVYTYNSGAAATYAITNWDTGKVPYGSANPFHDYYNFVDAKGNGGNCTNFASQCIMAGLVGSYKPSVVFESRGKFIADKGSLSISWYFISDSDRAKPWWSGADGLFQYARANVATNKGLHFVAVSFDFTKILPGDIVFADWTKDGTIDHSMIVTDLNTGINGFNRVHLVYQNRIGYANAADGLANVMSRNPNAQFHVYRPVNYTTTGN